MSLCVFFPVTLRMLSLKKRWFIKLGNIMCLSKYVRRSLKLNIIPFVSFCLFVSLAWGDISDKIFLRAMSKIFLPVFSSRIFMFSGLTFKSLMHFEFILVYAVRMWPSYIFLRVTIQFSQYHLLNKLSLAYCTCLLPLSNINWL